MNSAINILQLRSSSFLGSPEKMLISRIPWMLKLNCTYAFGIFDEQHNGNNTFFREAKKCNAQTMLFNGSMKHVTSNLKALTHGIIKFSSNIVCSHDFKANFHALALKKWSGIPAVSVLHGRTRKDLKIRIYYLIDALLMSGFDAVICVSESLRKKLNGFVSSKRVHVIPNAVDIDTIVRMSEMDISSSFDSENHVKKQIVFVGRLSREKGIGILIQAFSRLTELHKQVELVIIGDGPERTYLEKLIDSCRLNHSVRLLGFKKNVYPYIRRCEFLILPSLMEGMPVVLLEAFALKKPVVATSVGGIPDMVENGVEGILVTPRKEEEIATAIVELIRNPDQTKRMGMAAYNRIVADFSMDIQAKRYQATYQQVCRQFTTTASEVRE